MFKKKKKRKFQICCSVLSGIQSDVRTAISCSTNQQSRFVCLKLRPALLHLSPFKLLFSDSLPLGSNVWACRSAQCALSASVQDMRGRALKHSPSPHGVRCFAGPGRKEGRRSREGLVTCMCYHLTHPFTEENSPTPMSHKALLITALEKKSGKIVISQITKFLQLIPF